MQKIKSQESNDNQKYNFIKFKSINEYEFVNEDSLSEKMIEKNNTDLQEIEHNAFN